MNEQQQPVTAKASGPHKCKRCKGTRYFGIRVEAGAEVPRCPNCKRRIAPVDAIKAVAS